LLSHCSVACCSETRSKIGDEFDCSIVVGEKQRHWKTHQDHEKAWTTVDLWI
jgi:hypothetical protein